jgi:glutamine synthetase
MLALFLPKTNIYGSGCHVHMSIWKDGKNVIGDPDTKFGLSDAGENFFAGILHHYNALFHFLCPQPNSLRRVLPSHWVGAYKFWGFENKEAPLRLCSSYKVGQRYSNFEIKNFDHLANHYVALAALITCGIEGLKKNLRLPEPIEGDPGLWTEEKRQSIGLERLPTTYEERKRHIYSEAGKPLQDFFGKIVLESILSCHDEDHKFWAGKTVEEEVKTLAGRY